MQITATLTAESLIHRADLVLEIEAEDDAQRFTGSAFFLTSGEWIIPDTGRRYWEADVELIGCVVTGDDNTALVLSPDDACDLFGPCAVSAWTEQAREDA